MQNDTPTSLGSWMEELSHLLRASRLALRIDKLLLATLGLIATLIIGHTFDLIWVSCGGGLDHQALLRSPLIADLPNEAESHRGVFEALFEHEKHCLDEALKAASHFKITGGMGSICRSLGDGGGALVRPQVEQGYGLIAFILAAILGAYWVLTHHWLFSLVVGLLVVAVWSLCGGGICRISALQFTKGQQPSALSALAYAAWKFWQFLLAPLLPFAVILLFVLLLLVGGWITHIPLLGGLFFGLTLVGGAVVAMMLIFVVGSAGLMWPAIAVEGIDCADAIGRSSNYLYERMERAVVYALLAILYGAFVWVVVRFFGFLLAYCVHGVVGITFADIHQMWETPSYDRLYAVPGDSKQIEGWRYWLTFLPIRAWVSVGGIVLYSYLVSYFFTCSTIIYFLLRSRVDENELDDVYVAPPEPSSGPASP